MNWYKDILHLFTRLSEQSFHNILAYGTIARALTNLVVSTIVLYVMTYALPLMVKAIAPMLGIKRMTGFAHFDMISAVANASFLIFQILIGAFVIWRLLILLGGSGTYRGVMCNYIYGLAYTNALPYRSIGIGSYSGSYIILCIYAKICRRYGLSCYHV